MNMQAKIKHRSADFTPRHENNETAQAILADGAMAMVWIINNALGTGLRCRVLAPDGATERMDFILDAGDIDRSKLPRVTALADGGFRIGWVEKTKAGAKIESEEIHRIAV